jgi:hypothetical protein
MTDQNLPQVVLAPEPFTPRAEVLEVPALGQKVSDLVSAAVRQGKLKADADTIRRLRVHVNGVPLPADTQEQRLAAMQYVPQPGEVINLVVVVQGGGGGGDTGKVLQTVLTVAVIALSLYVGGGAATPGFLDAAWIRAAGAATVAVGGQMAISALMGTPETMQSSNDASALKDGSNRYRPRAPMPLVLGRRHWTFDLSAPPFTTTIGQDVFLTLAVSPHYGRCWVGNLKIGETLLSDYPAEDIQVEYFLEPGVPRRSALYPNSVAQENFQDKLDFTGGGVWDVHTALQTADRMEVDIELPSGLRYNSPSSGKVRNEEVAGQIQFAEVGTENWAAATFPGHDTTRDKNGILLPPGSFYLNLKTPDPVRRTFGWAPPDTTKLYKVRVRAYDRDGDFPDQGERTWTTMWTALRAIRNAPPITDQNLATIFIRVRSTDDLNGSLPVISGEVEPIVPVYRGGNWNTEERSSNAAALMRWLLTGPAAATPLEFAEFHSSLETTFQLIEANPSWKGGLLVTEDRSQQDVMVALGKMGRFSTYWNGSKLCFVPDWVRGAPRQVFSGRNAAGYRYRRTFPKPIHAVFIEFSNLDQGSLEDELYVYSDGYDASNATLIETLRIDFVCTQERAFQEGRVYLAKRLLQVEMHEWSAGLDAIATTYGDRVLVRHPATLYGLADGRVVNRFFQGALISGFRLDEAVEMEAGKTYGIDVRRGDGTVLRGIPVVNQPGVTRVLQFAAPRTEAQSPRKGDLVIFGETGLISEDLEIVDIEPQEDMSVTFRAIPYIPDAIQEAINNPVPELPSKVTPRLRAPKPTLSRPESVDPMVGAAIKASIGHWDGTPVASFAGRWRTTIVDAVDGPLTTPWASLESVSAIDGVIRTGPITGAAHAPPDGQQVLIDVEVRTVLSNGEFSEATVLAAIPVLAQIPAPDAFTAQGLQRTRSDGSSFGAIAVSATPISVGDILTLEVEVQKDDGSPWVTPTGGLIPARVATTDVLGLDVGEPGYSVRGRWIRSDNWPGPWAVAPELIVIPAFSDVSSDTVTVGGYPASDLLADLASVEALAAQTAASVQDLEDLYGDTASAAASAAAAAASEAAAIQAKADAIIAAADAANAASASSTAKLAAETARAQAETARDESVSSATSAAGSAATATTQAGIATSAMNDAQAASSAAVTARNQSASFADDAGASAAAAQSARVAAEAALGQMGAPNLVARESVSAGGAAVTMPAPSQSAWGFRMTGSGGNQTRTITVGPLKASTPYSLSFLGRRTAGTGTTPVNVDIYLTSALAATTRNLTDEWTRFTWEAFQSSSPDMTSPDLRLRFFRNPMASGLEYEITDIKLEEKSTATAWSPSPRDAAFYARSSAESASVASASQTAAESAASAATTAKTQAETARGQAQTAATQASSSRDDAAGSAANASASATQAANSRDAAAGSASAAAGSASTASTKAGEAGTYASAALASQVSASTARDEALQALMQQGRTNLVARENVTPGSPVTAPSPSLSGWGFTMTGNGGGVERGIVVGPLKQDTPYSVSFRARRSDGATPQMALSVDLYPDTLPERVFQIGPDWTDFKWEGLTSAHPDMTLPNVRLRFFRSPLVVGLQFEVTNIKLEEGATATAWTPSPKDAPASAQAAATSASSAAASETAAGASATSASGSATTATTAAGQAQTYSNQASSSATAAAGSATTASQASGTAVSARDTAIGARNDAQGAAATAIAQASSASASAASAQISADLAASVSNSSGFNIVKNSTFADGFTFWNSTSWAPSNLTAPVGPHAFTANNGTNNLTSDAFPVNANFQYTLSADFRAQGASGSVVCDVQWLNASGGHIAYSARISAPVSSNVNFNQPRKSVTFSPAAGATQARVRVYTENVTGLSLNGAAVRQIKLEAGDKATTWRDDSQLVDLNANLKITASTTADLATRMATAQFEVTAAVGGNPAQLKIRADSTGSLAALVAQAVSFSNTISGTVVEVMRIIGGSVYITGKLFMGAAGQIELDPAYPLILWKFGNARLAIGQLPNDSLFFWFGQGASTAITAMRKNNAKVWFDTNGNSYWGGSIIAGTISNSGQGSLITVPASFTLGPFGTNGGPITVVWSYDYSRTGKRWGDQTGGVTGQTTALVRFYRKIGTAAETLIDSMTVTGTFNAYYDAEPVPGQPSGTQGQTFFTEYMGGSRTYTDNAGGTQQRTYRVEVVTRSLRSVPGQSNELDAQRQAYGITSSE